ncbi:MAG: hypothetical protein O2960_16235 [Verrucomicrobia bacterium]|nr:hypothetical protein [Verrucomicrobiota bacterium]
MKDSKSLPGLDAPFVNEMRLTLRQWFAVGGILTIVVLCTPLLWKRLEKFETDANYRIPYGLSKDYWLYQRWLNRTARSDGIFVVGDSVVWGEYVRPDGTLPSFLSRESAANTRFINAGVNGLFPLALEGLVRDYGGAIRNRKVILHCNLLWMSSPKVDLQTPKEEKFNHPRLVPQFQPWIPCYKADIADRLGILVERNLPFLTWVNHLQNAYFNQKNILDWTLADDGQDPPGYPNVYQNPLAQINFEVPSAPDSDPERGVSSSRHKPWSKSGQGSARFDWVPLETSLQWGAFQRLTKILASRGNDLLVVVGPFNEHMLSEENRLKFRQVLNSATDWFSAHRIKFVQPETLPSDLYADASHPLTDGYLALARELLNSEEVQNWMRPHGSP